MITTCAFPANIFNLMASEKVAPTAGLDSKDFSNTTSRQDAASTDSSSNEERAAGDLGSNGDHVFLDPKVAEYWRGVYEAARYECRHRFDPSATWTPEEEKKLRRKVSDTAPGLANHHY
jgi:hypothetical protein